MWKSNKFKKQSGQVMLLTIVVLSGTLMTVSGVVGFLMLHKIRQSTDIVNSAKAIFAADSGIEWELYRCFKCKSVEICDFSCASPYDNPPPMTNSSNFTAIITDIDTDGKPDFIKSIGKAGNTARAFLMMLQGATGP
ncbi:MAG: hypothetical protein AAB516_00300 [Patescibacteria group bacterium]